MECLLVSREISFERENRVCCQDLFVTLTALYPLNTHEQITLKQDCNSHISQHRQSLRFLGIKVEEDVGGFVVILGRVRNNSGKVGESECLSLLFWK